jgi:hypothetical protein
MTRVNEECIRGAVVEYMRRQLGQGKSLGMLLLKTVAFEKGDVDILTPAPLNPTEIVEFDRGHAPQTQIAPKRITIGDAPYIAIPKDNASVELANLIGKLLIDADDLCVLENSLAQASDGWLKRAKSRIVTNGSDVYHVLFNVDRDANNVSNAVREAEALPVFIGAVGKIPADQFARDGSANTISTEALIDFAKTVRCVFVGSYDGEGYVLWKLAD